MHHKRTIGQIISILLVIAVGLSVWGLSCGPINQKSGPEVTLTIWRPIDDEEIFKPIIRDFQQEYPNIKINYFKKDLTEYEENSVDALASGEGPDIWSIRNDWMAKHWKKLIAAPAGLFTQQSGKKDGEVYKETFAPVAAEDALINDQIYGVPFSVDTLVLYYNTDLFREVKTKLEDEGKIDPSDRTLEEPPANWEEVEQYTKLLTEKDNQGNISRAGIALGAASNIGQAIDVLSALMLQNHTTMISADKKSAAFNLSIPKETGEPYYPGRKALEFYTKFADSGSDVYSWSASMPYSLDAFKDNKLAIMIDYGYQRYWLAQNAPLLSYNIGPLPQIKGETTATDYASYWLETVTKNSQHPQEAWTFLYYVATKGINQYLSSTKRPSPYKVNSELVPQVLGRVDEKGGALEFQKATAKTWYKGKYPLKVDRIFYEMIENVSTHRQPIPNVIDSAASQVTSLLRKD